MNNNDPIAYMVANVPVKQNAVVHIATLCYGFETNGDIKPGFHNHILKCAVKSEEVTYFTARNIGVENLVQLVDQNGDIIAIPAMSSGKNILKNMTAIIIFTRYLQTPIKINALFAGFVGAINNRKWNGELLKQKVMPMTPDKFLLTIHGIGKFICQSECERIIKRFYSNFLPRNRWGQPHKALLRTF